MFLLALILDNPIPQALKMFFQDGMLVLLIQWAGEMFS